MVSAPAGEDPRQVAEQDRRDARRRHSRPAEAPLGDAGAARSTVELRRVLRVEADLARRSPRPKRPTTWGPAGVSMSLERCRRSPGTSRGPRRPRAAAAGRPGRSARCRAAQRYPTLRGGEVPQQRDRALRRSPRSEREGVPERDHVELGAQRGAARTREPGHSGAAAAVAPSQRRSAEAPPSPAPRTRGTARARDRHGPADRERARPVAASSSASRRACLAKRAK